MGIQFEMLVSVYSENLLKTFWVGTTRRASETDDLKDFIGTAPDEEGSWKL